MQCISWWRDLFIGAWVKYNAGILKNIGFSGGIFSRVGLQPVGILKTIGFFQRDLFRGRLNLYYYRTEPESLGKDPAAGCILLLSF